MDLHEFLDTGYGRRGDRRLRNMLRNGADPNAAVGPSGETPLHVATRRRRLSAVRLLLRAGADIDARTAHRKTAWVHAARRGFAEITALLARRGADCTITLADRLAISLS